MKIKDILLEGVGPFDGGVKKKSITSKHVPLIWENMLGTVYARNPKGVVEYFDYDFADARKWARVADMDDLRVVRADREYTYQHGASLRKGKWALFGIPSKKLEDEDKAFDKFKDESGIPKEQHRRNLKHFRGGRIINDKFYIIAEVKDNKGYDILVIGGPYNSELEASKGTSVDSDYIISGKQLKDQYKQVGGTISWLRKK